MRPKKESLSRSNQVRSIVFLTASSIAKNIAFKIHRFFEKLRLFSMWKEYWLGGQKDLINHVSHAKEKRHKVIKIKLPNNMTDDLIIKNFFSAVFHIFSHNQIKLFWFWWISPIFLVGNSSVTFTPKIIFHEKF